MSHPPLTTLQNKNPKAVRTPIGWAHKDTGEQLVSMRGLEPIEEACNRPNSGPGSFECKGPGGEVLVKQVTVSPKTVTVQKGSKEKITATVEPADAANKTVEYTTSDDEVATVDASGEITGVSEGSATVTARSVDGSDKSDVCSVTVTPAIVAVASVAVAPKTASVKVGATSQLTATVSPADATNKAVTWKSGTVGVATVSNSGVVTAVSNGSATITVTTADGAKTDTCTVTVTTAVTGVTLDKTAETLVVDGTLQLTATVAPATASNKATTWSTSDAAIATVSATGLVTAKAAGSATITVSTTDGAKKATCAVTVQAE